LLLIFKISSLKSQFPLLCFLWYLFAFCNF
jgi:hypothetical protein